LVEPPLLLLRLRCELALVELLLELVPFFEPDDELFALDDERELLPVLVCAIEDPPSGLQFPLSSGDLTSATRVRHREPGPGPKIACKVAGRAGRSRATPSGRTAKG
jgi:hypothetical protein